MKGKLNYQIDRPEAGVLTYRKGGTEYRFPVFDQDGETVFVAWPTSQRIFLFFLFKGWTRVPQHFSTEDRLSITSHVVEHLERDGRQVRVMTRDKSDTSGFQFHPELFECKSRASEVLDSVGVTWFSDYSAIDMLHEEFGLEVCGIREESTVGEIIRAMRAEFPQWHYCKVFHKAYGREVGWKFSLHMFPGRCGGGRCEPAD